MTKTLPDLKTLLRPKSPNTALMAPEGMKLASEVDGVVPVFDTPVERLKEQAVGLWSGLKHIKLEVQTAPPGAMAHFIATTPLLRFKDDVYVEFVPVSENQSSFIIYSASRVGYSDLGTNRKRVEGWLEQLVSTFKGT